VAAGRGVARTSVKIDKSPSPMTPKLSKRSLDSPLEGDGFELPVPRAMQARLKAKIAGFGCMPSSIIWGCRFRAR
jgi:hypothetical protein